MMAVIPAHNEHASLPALVDELRRVTPELELLVVDDGSTDETPALLPRLGVRWLRLPMRLGIGTALRAGLRYAQHLGRDTVVRLDADGQHDPRDIAALVAALGTHDAAVGSRYAGAGTGYRASLLRRMLQRLVAASVSLVTRRRITDPTSGFWAFGPRALALLAAHHPTGYAEPELHLLLWRNRLSVVEVPVTMRERAAGESTLTLPRAALALSRVALALVVAPLRALDE
jgi:glycosyltransferase involved in cell wall biosynthesis